MNPAQTFHFHGDFHACPKLVYDGHEPIDREAAQVCITDAGKISRRHTGHGVIGLTTSALPPSAAIVSAANQID